MASDATVPIFRTRITLRCLFPGNYGSHISTLAITVVFFFVFFFYILAILVFFLKYFYSFFLNFLFFFFLRMFLVAKNKKILISSNTVLPHIGLLRGKRG